MQPTSLLLRISRREKLNVKAKMNDPFSPDLAYRFTCLRHGIQVNRDSSRREMEKVRSEMQDVRRKK